ncbi:MAG TPA: molybdopterin converting factor subunit 1 [Usitatibacteraceae bacterium]
MLTILYFASLRESVGKAGESLALPVNATVAGLVAELRSRGDAWAAALDAGKRWRVAVNQEMATLETPLHAGDEVAIFPPVTGG